MQKGRTLLTQRTHRQNYTPPNAQESEYQSIPLNKIEDFGVHSSRYYPLEISHFKSAMDAQLLESLWNKYWVMTLSQSPLISVSVTPSQLAQFGGPFRSSKSTADMGLMERPPATAFLLLLV